MFNQDPLFSTQSAEQNFTTKANLREHLMVHEAGGTEQPPNGAIVAPSPGYTIVYEKKIRLKLLWR